MEELNCIENLREKDILEFGTSCSFDEEISLKLNSIEIIRETKNDFINKLFNDEKLLNVNNDDIIDVYSSKIHLIFNGYNFLWWNKTKKRKEKFENAFFNEGPSVVEKPTKKTKVEYPSTEYSVGVATLIDGVLSNIHWFEGSKKECIEFINKDIFDRYIDEGLKAKVVVNLTFDKDEFERTFSENDEEGKLSYKTSLLYWYTLDELQDMGAITLQ